MGTESPLLVWNDSAKATFDGADAILIPTEWGEFTTLDFEAVGARMRQKVLFDFRNIYRKEQLEKAGFEYYGTGIR